MVDLSGFGSINIVSLLIACLFFIPLLAGALWPLSGDRVRRSFMSLFNSLILLVAVLAAVYLTRLLLSDSENDVLTFLYGLLPALRTAVLHRDIWVYAVFFAVILLAVGGLLDLLAIPFFRYAVVPVSNRFASSLRSMGGAARRAIGGLWQLPKAVLLVLAFTLLLNFYAEANPGAPAAAEADRSAPYQLIRSKVIRPLLNNSAVRNIQVLLNDSFRQAKDELSNVARGKPLVRYFNGVTLDEAVLSNEEIDARAKRIVGGETDDRRKAYLLYKWICKNIRYDNDKAAVIAKDPSGVSSGAIVAFETKTGVCFDYACLYVAMCRAAGVKVRFVTGLGYTGTAWGDHAWNQAYDGAGNAWIDVDTTFGSSGADYFGTPGFARDHRDAVIQAEWQTR